MIKKFIVIVTVLMCFSFPMFAGQTNGNIKFFFCKDAINGFSGTYKGVPVIINFQFDHQAKIMTIGVNNDNAKKVIEPFVDDLFSSKTLIAVCKKHKVYCSAVKACPL